MYFYTFNRRIFAKKKNRYNGCLTAPFVVVFLADTVCQGLQFIKIVV